MKRIAPLELAERWDNTGIIAESPLHLGNNVLLTIDLTPDVVQEAIVKGAGVIVSYHPPWFQSVKKLTLDGPLSLISECLCKGISLYSPHTVYIGFIFRHSMRSQTEVIPYIQILVNDWLFNRLEIDPSIALNYQAIVPSKSSPDQPTNIVGMGRTCQLKKELDFDGLLLTIAKNFNLKTCTLVFILVRYIKVHDKVSSIALCAGSGFDILKECTADLIITGELRHHDMLFLKHQKNTSCILLEHCNSERGYLEDILRESLLSELKVQSPEWDGQVFVSEKDKCQISNFIRPLETGQTGPCTHNHL